MTMSERIQIEVENIKCGGCARSINQALEQLPGVGGVEVDVQAQIVSFNGEPATRQPVADKLLSLGYPEKGTLAGVGAAVAGAKSFVSCAIGRMS